MREPQTNQKASDLNAVFQKHLAWLMISILLDDFRINAYIIVRSLLELDILSWGDDVGVFEMAHGSKILT